MGKYPQSTRSDSMSRCYRVLEVEYLIVVPADPGRKVGEQEQGGHV